jgi:hypothetical protein
MDHISDHTQEVDRAATPDLRHNIAINHDRVHPTSFQEALSVTDYTPARSEHPAGRPRPGPLGRLGGVAFRNKGWRRESWSSSDSVGSVPVVRRA